MRKFVRRGAVVVTTVALVSSMGMAGAQAGESKRGKLKVCFENSTLLSGLELDAVADGPKHREESLAGGECEKWKIKKGQYKITMDDAEDFFDAAFAGEFTEEGEVFDACEPGLEPEFTVEVTRNGEDYDVDFLGANTSFLTHVEKKRKTEVEFRLRCVEEGTAIFF